MASRLRLASWNVNGLRAIWKKGFPEWLAKEQPDVVCIQETKAHINQLSDEMVNFMDYEGYFFPAERKGYSGVAVYTRLKPQKVLTGFGVPRFDVEGRVLQLDYGSFVLFNVYFPNGGRGPERVQYKLEFYEAMFDYVENLRKEKKKIIVCGDYNTAHKEIDLARPKENEKTSGFLPEERAWIDRIVEMRYVDSFRYFNQEPGWYTYWDPITRARERNIGWRIDYFFVTDALMPHVEAANIYMEVMGSDHCPIDIYLNINL
ncbi:MAG: exodeoxyribonuclease III [Chitinophagales bacterium]|nr:exodeoxyribonuclease III [Chitinophagales bacterium]MDW8428200.1 exodeoxyribonuclease III [Chitinophagales bacterium]